MKSRLSGNEAVAYAMKQIDPDVMGAFPITPSTEIPEYFAQYVADGQVNTEYVTVESEHSSMSVCIAAQAAGARAVSATSSCGLALMYELLYVAASDRLPITLAWTTTGSLWIPVGVIGVLAVVGLCLWATAKMHLPKDGAGTPPHETYRYLGSSLVCLAGYAMLMNLDTTLAKHYFDSETVGRFAKAATIARTAVFLPVPVAAALFPKVTTAGELTEDSWRLLERAMAFAGLLIAVVVGVCLFVPQLPWTILYGPWSAETAASSALWTRAMVLAMSPLALAYLLLNFEMAQRRFFWCYGLVPGGLAYVGLVARFHSQPLQIALALGALNLAVVGILLAGIISQRRLA